MPVFAGASGVDDDPGARAMAVRCLTKVGLPIFEAETGFEALHILTQHPEVIAEGIVQGIECFVNNESVNPTPLPTIPVIVTPSS